MNFYIKSLFIAIPIFMLLIIMEEIFARFKGVRINNSADMVSSLSSGLTNIIRDGIRFSVIIISYPWLMEKIAEKVLDKSY